MPEFRKDPVTGRWIIISSERAARSQGQVIVTEPVETDPCPFCAGNEALTPPEVLAYRGNKTQVDMPGWTVRVVPNKYPALVNDGSWTGHTEGIYESIDGLGVHEVIIESPEHIVNMAALNVKQTSDVLRAYRQRMLELRNDKRWRYILLYKNQGAQAGATLEHIHSQLIALPAVPKEALEEIAGASAYFDSARRCIYCAIIQQETDQRKRIVIEHERFVALCPFAPRFPYETWILPREHASRFEEISKNDVVELSRALRDMLIRLNRRLENPPFNYIIHSNPLDAVANGYYHWHIEILPKLMQAAGFEWGSGAAINPVAPEDAAQLLRAALA